MMPPPVLQPSPSVHPATAAAAAAAAARRHASSTRRHQYYHRHHPRRLVAHEVNSEDPQAADNGCRECEELYQRHRRCLSVACYALSLAYLLCLATLTYLYVARQAHNLALLAADVAGEIPADPADCFLHARPLDYGGSGTDVEARRVAESLPMTDCGVDSVGLLHSLPPPRLQRLRHIDNSLLVVSATSVDIVQWPTTSAAAKKTADCGWPAAAAAAGAVACAAAGNLTIARLPGGGCPLTHFLESDMRLRLRLALRLLALADRLDAAAEAPAPAVLSSATQLDDFGVDRSGHVRLINARRLRVLRPPDAGGGGNSDGADGPDSGSGGCAQPGSLASHAIVASLLHDAYDYMASGAAYSGSADRSPPALGRSFLRGWSNWRLAVWAQRQQSQQQPQEAAQLPLLPGAWRRLSDADKLAERQRLLRAIEESLHSDDPVLASLWWSVCLMSSGTLVFVLLRYWFCFKLILCLERTCA